MVRSDGVGPGADRGFHGWFRCFWPADLAESKIRRIFAAGEMAEWSIAAVLKTVEPQGSGGSNPSLSARAGKAAMKSQLFYFGEQPGLPEAARQNKKVAFRHFPALAGTPPAGKGTASNASQSRPDRRCRAVRIKCRPPLRQIAAGRQGNGEQSKTILPRPTMPRSSNKIPPAAPPDRRRQARERRATRANPAHG